MTWALIFMVVAISSCSTEAQQIASTDDQQVASTFDDVTAGMKCSQNSLGDLECHYKVGRSLYIVIAGVGRNDAGIAFNASSYEGDYYAGFGLLHGCIIVKPGLARKTSFTDFAFISPGNGKVYRDWESCRDRK